MILLPALSSVNDILDTDLILVEHSTGEGFKMTGADLKALMKAQAVDTVALNNMQSVTSNAVSRALSYSTTEANTGKTWIDGRPIYRKVLTATLQTDEQVLNLTISNQIQSLVRVEGTLSKENIDFPIPYCFIDTSSKLYQVYCYCQGRDLNIIPRSTDGDYFVAGCTVKAIVEYTKTTD